MQLSYNKPFLPAYNPERQGWEDNQMFGTGYRWIYCVPSDLKVLRPRLWYDGSSSNSASQMHYASSTALYVETHRQYSTHPSVPHPTLLACSSPHEHVYVGNLETQLEWSQLQSTNENQSMNVSQGGLLNDVSCLLRKNLLSQANPIGLGNKRHYTYAVSNDIYQQSHYKSATWWETQHSPTLVPINVPENSGDYYLPQSKVPRTASKLSDLDYLRQVPPEFSHGAATLRNLVLPSTSKRSAFGYNAYFLHAYENLTQRNYKRTIDGSIINKNPFENQPFLNTSNSINAVNDVYAGLSIRNPWHLQGMPETTAAYAPIAYSPLRDKQLKYPSSRFREISVLRKQPLKCWINIETEILRASSDIPLPFEMHDSSRMDRLDDTSLINAMATLLGTIPYSGRLGRRIKVVDTPQPPSMSSRDFFLRLVTQFKCSVTCYILALIYLDRLCQKDQEIEVDTMKFNRLFLGSTLCAAKFYDDIFLSNCVYAKVGGVTIEELNELEAWLLSCLDFRLVVSPVELLQYFKLLLSIASMQHARLK